MIRNTRNWSNDRKSEREKGLFSVQSVKNHGTKTTFTSQYCVCDYEKPFN